MISLLIPLFMNKLYARINIFKHLELWQLNGKFFRRPIKAKPESIENITKATICLHNYLHLTDRAHYLPSGFVDCKTNSGDVIPGDWRKITADVFRVYPVLQVINTELMLIQ